MAQETDKEYWCGAWSWSFTRDCTSGENIFQLQDCWFQRKNVDLRADNTATYQLMSPYGRENHECTWHVRYVEDREEACVLAGTDLLVTIVRGDPEWHKAA
eukprot:TRINITY_DN2675_c0_g3_i1.p1 TRINITY_DN2675_c0_g3~~TRINITY_DN2675_c0_g3_i1.p1  ORF type:complete len:101 (+),score=8.67 TRINITY_DN2675_c0_g3_i1:122-424(+)